MRTRPPTRCTRSSRCSPRTRKWRGGCAEGRRTGAAAATPRTGTP
uniref:Uncharacterized protein n=1 Tax=Arundo donax TaxID=35708 RepID=A0A0A9HIH2_ARUDO